MTWFDATTVAPDEGLSVVPAGAYTAIVSDAIEKQNKAGNGTNLELTFQIVGGPQAGRKIKTWLALDNQSGEAVRIARGKLSAICHAVRVLQPRSPQELTNIPLDIDVKVKPREDKPGEFSNEIASFKKKGSLTVGAPAVATQPASPAQTVTSLAGGPKPWSPPRTS
jgi:hypothetical protein